MASVLHCLALYQKHLCNALMYSTGENMMIMPARTFTCRNCGKDQLFIGESITIENLRASGWQQCLATALELYFCSNDCHSQYHEKE